MIIVTGGTGRIGSHVVRGLLAQGRPTRVLARRPDAARAQLPDGTEVVEADLDRPETLDAAMAGASSLFLLTTQSPRQAGQERAALDAAARAGVGHVVKVSASDAATGPDSPTPVGRAHAASEAALKATGMAWTILRPSAFMQVALTPLLEQARTTGRLQFPIGSARVAFVDVADIARAGVWALTHRTQAAGRTLSVTGPEALGLLDLADRFTARPSRPVAAASPPAWLAALVLARRIRDPFLRRHQLALLGLMRKGELATVSRDLEDATGSPGRTVAAWLKDIA
ncbi:MAG: NAD(P)H-binding protein [Pseudomonadota bacterium]